MPQGHYDTMVSQICNRLNVNGVYSWARPKTLKRILPCAKSTGCSIPTSFAVGINSTYNFHIMIFMKIESH